MGGGEGSSQKCSSDVICAGANISDPPKNGGDIEQVEADQTLSATEPPSYLQVVNQDQRVESDGRRENRDGADAIFSKGPNEENDQSFVALPKAGEVKQIQC